MTGAPYEEENKLLAAPSSKLKSSSSSSDGEDSSSEELEEGDDREGRSFFAGFNSEDEDSNDEEEDEEAKRQKEAAEAASRERRKQEARQQRQFLAAKVKEEKRAARLKEEEEDDSWIRPRFRLDIPPVDVIIGSELTYSPANVYNLISVIKKYLKPDGVFYEILSDDRDGVSLFVTEVQAAGFTVEIFPVPPRFLGHYATNQKSETYKFYTFRWKDQPLRFPTMGQE